jgi:hypothetical protein
MIRALGTVSRACTLLKLPASQIIQATACPAMKQRDIASFFGKKAGASTTPPAVTKAKPSAAAAAPAAGQDEPSAKRQVRTHVPTCSSCHMQHLYEHIAVSTQ